jgi:hypothetical protein
MIIIWLAEKYRQRFLYVILRRSSTKKKLSPLEGDLPFFLGKGKKSIDLESVVTKSLL